ncbi:hypothetical protein QQP08_006267 [Theobroma cacao]|nr:hypothetical protein QQP08_006267 [Theobroma cacao]
MACMASGMTLLANISMRLCCSHTGQGVEALCVSTPVCIMASNETQDPDYSNSSTTPCGPFFQTSCDSSENLKGRPASVRHLIKIPTKPRIILVNEPCINSSLSHGSLSGSIVFQSLKQRNHRL